MENVVDDQLGALGSRRRAHGLVGAEGRALLVVVRGALAVGPVIAVGHDSGHVSFQMTGRVN